MNKLKAKPKWDGNKVFRIATQLFQVLTAVLMVFITVLIYRVNSNHFELEKHKQTIRLCENFNDWYRYADYNLKKNENLVVIKLWEGSIDENQEGIDSLPDIWQKWKTLSLQKKKEKLEYNVAMQRLLGYFEDAKMLDEKNLLDRNYFFNFFVSVISRLEQAENPSLADFLKYVRTEHNDTAIWDGYEHCRDKIIKQKRLRHASKN